MASFTQGYDQERFVTTINRNFLCLICFNVLKDPVLCPRNQHCFCRGCITKHLENSRRCPTCADELTEETLIVPSRMVRDYLDEAKIRCVYHDRGCQEVVQLQHLDQHEGSCGFTPTVCANPGCGATLNKRDLTIHESELCEYRTLKCHSCGEMTKILADMEKRMARVETNQANVEKNMKTQFTNLKTQIENTNTTMQNNTAILEAKLAESVETIEQNVAQNIANMEGKLEAVNNEVKGMKTAFVESFDQMKDVLVKMEENIKENAKVRNAPIGGDRENIIVAGGYENNSVEMFNWRQRTWSPLQSMPKTRYGATSFVYHNQVVIAGGCCAARGCLDDMIRVNADSHRDLSTHWSECPVKLPAKLQHHSSVLYDDKLMVTGGYNGNATSDKIHEVQLVPPYTVKTLSRMPERRQLHCTEIFDDSLLILGGRTTGISRDSLSSVVLYDIKNNVCKQLAPLPNEVSDMATVRWGDNVIVIGGLGKRGNALNTVIMYNVKTQQSQMLPPMRHMRWRCAAVVAGNNIVVLGGGISEPLQTMKSAECFNFERNTWQELPEMSQARCWHTAVVA